MPGESHALVDVAQSTSFIFTGVVVEVGASNVAALASGPELITVRITRVLRSPPAVGDLTGRLITVATRSVRALRAGGAAVFFTRSWIRGDTIAVQEVLRMGMDSERDAEAAVAAIPEADLRNRLAIAELVTLATVSAVRDVPNQRPSRHGPNWKAAELDVQTFLKGTTQQVTLLFPTATTVEWYRSPRFAAGQKAIFIVRRDDPRAAAWVDEDAMGLAARTSLDAADVRSPSEESKIGTLIAALGDQGPR